MARSSITVFVIVFTVLESGVCVLPVQSSVVFVDDDAAPGGDGATWTTAFRHLQDALARADADASVDEIRVAGGVYRPDTDEAGGITPGDRTASFVLRTGVRVIGGFAGLANPGAPDMRDTTLHSSRLSGDLAANDAPQFLDRSDNSLHVVRAVGGISGADLEGFTIRGGHADGNAHPDDSGGGLLAVNTEVRLRECLFEDNHADQSGAGALVSGAPTSIVDCVFRQNRADNRGGGLLIRAAGDAWVVNSSFERNSSGATGSGFASEGSCPDDRNVHLVNCVFAGNTSEDTLPVAVFLIAGADAITNCTVAQNDMGLFVQAGTVQIFNSIFWGNGGGDEWSQVARGGLGQAHVQYSNVQGASLTLGNISVDPVFVDATGPDGIAGTGDEDFRLSQGSPCVDTALNAFVPADASDVDGDGDVLEEIPTDRAGGPRRLDDPSTPDGGGQTPPVVDMGAFEFQVTPTAVPSATPRVVSLTAWPNPFNPTVTLDFTLEHRADVRLTIHDPAGRLIVRLRGGMLDAGEYRATWDGRDSRGRGLPTGTYVAVLHADSARRATKLMLMK